MNVALEMIKTEAFSSGRQEGILDTLIGLVRKGRLTVAEASAEAGMALSRFNAKMAEYDARQNA